MRAQNTNPTMPRYTVEQTRQQYEKLPPVLKNALFSVEISEKMMEIGNAAGLTIEKTGLMAEETGLVILGLTHPNEFVGHLKNALYLGTEQAQMLGDTINREIFFPLREEMKSTHAFDIASGTSTVAQGESAPRVGGMQMPVHIQRRMIEEHSPLVIDLTRTREIAAPTPIIQVPTVPLPPPDKTPPSTPILPTQSAPAPTPTPPILPQTPPAPDGTDPYREPIE